MVFYSRIKRIGGKKVVNRPNRDEALVVDDRIPVKMTWGLFEMDKTGDIHLITPGEVGSLKEQALFF